MVLPELQGMGSNVQSALKLLIRDIYSLMRRLGSGVFQTVDV